MLEKKFKAKKVNLMGNELIEELTMEQINTMTLSSGFMSMLKRMGVGEVLYYNEIKIEFQRIQ